MKYLLLILFLSLLSCTKTEPPEPIRSELQTCHDLNIWDMAAIEEHIIKRWRWLYATCPDREDEAFFQVYKGLIIEFFDDKTCEITYDGVSPQAGTYNIAEIDGKYFKLNVTPDLLTFRGRMLFCNNELEFNNGINGCNSHFLITF